MRANVSATPRPYSLFTSMIIAVLAFMLSTPCTAVVFITVSARGTRLKMKLPILRMLGFCAAVFTRSTPCCCATGPRASTTLLPTVSTIGTLSTLRSLLSAARESLGSFLPSSRMIRIFLPPIQPPFSMSSRASWLPRMKYSPNWGMGPVTGLTAPYLNSSWAATGAGAAPASSTRRIPRTTGMTRRRPDASLGIMRPPCPLAVGARGGAPGRYCRSARRGVKRGACARLPPDEHSRTGGRRP